MEINTDFNSPYMKQAKSNNSDDAFESPNVFEAYNTAGNHLTRSQLDIDESIVVSSARL